VTGLDIATNLVETARGRARAEGLHVCFDEGDAEQMPYGGGSFDVVVTMFGAMANWTPSGFIGRMFKTTAAHVAPPDIPSPLLWGDEATVRERLRDGAAELHFNRRTVAFRLPLTPEQTVDFFREWYGPTLRAFASLDADGRAALRRDLTRLWTEHNRATDGTTHVESEYLEVVVTKHG